MGMRRYQIDPKIGRLRDSFFIAFYPTRIVVESRRGNLRFLGIFSYLLICMKDLRSFYVLLTTHIDSIIALIVLVPKYAFLYR
jgi:hypothetical protein